MAEHTEGRIRLSLAAGIAGLILTGCAGLAGHDSGTDVTRGRKVAAAACSGCHDIDGVGRGLASGPPGFSDERFRHTAALPGRLADLTRKGHYAMPARALTPAQLEDLLAYIERADPKD